MTRRMVQETSGRKPWKPFFAVVLLSVLVRVFLWSVYSPVEYSDSGAYLRLGKVLLDVSLSGYDGSRVPGYPLFIALLRLDPKTIWFLQMSLGVVTAGLLFWITWRTTNDPGASLLVGGAQAVFPATALFEANILTETLTFFLITLTLALFVAHTQSRIRWRKLVLAGLLGIFSSLVGLVRPMFFPLTLWLIPFLWSAGGTSSRTKLGVVALFVIFPLLMQGGWLYFMRTHFHVIAPTAIGGYNLVQHSGEFFEDLPDEYAEIRDVYIRYRDEQIAARGSQNNAIWQAVPELTESSGMNFYELSRKLDELSWMLIRGHPGGYLINVIEGWLWFWKAPVYWQAEALSNPGLQPFVWAWIAMGRAVALAANATFLLLTAALLISRKVRNWVRIDAMYLFVGGFIWWTSILQSLFEHGDNPRFLVPLQLIVVYFVVRSVYDLYHSLVKVR